MLFCIAVAGMTSGHAAATMEDHSAEESVSLVAAPQVCFVARCWPRLVAGDGLRRHHCRTKLSITTIQG